MADRIEPFVIAVDEAALDDLRDRLRRTRWPWTALGSSGIAGSAGRWLAGDKGNEDVVDDLAQDVVGDGFERHHHFVAEEVEGQTGTSRPTSSGADRSARPCTATRNSTRSISA